MKKILSSFLLALCFLSYNYTSAQTLITVGTASTSNVANTYPCPYGNQFWGAKHDLLYLASELTALGMSKGDISSLAFNVSVLNVATTLQNFSLKIKTTSATAVNTTFGTGFTQVLSAASVPVSLGWNTHTFSTPFYWDGTSNLLVEVCFNNTSASVQNPFVTYTATSFQSVIYYRQSGVANVCNALSGTFSANRPNTQFEFTPSPVPPVTDFSANVTTTCQGTVNFTDASCCLVSSWAWDFGDSTQIDTTQNPTHIYAQPGIYTVSLITTNTFGSDTLVKANYITISAGGANAATCNPTSATPFGGFGISNVTFNTINNTSAAGNVGYEDFSCSGQTTVYEGSTYNLSLSASTAVGTQNFRAWIDFNNDGVFTVPGETVLSVDNAASASTSFLIPVGAVLNTPLRMRVAADYDFSANPPAPCGTYDFGQGEDYSVTIIQNTNPPQVDFTVDAAVTCSGNVLFTDNSNNSPNTWDWDFGDNTTSQSQNPAHTYLASGDYTVTLIATNAFGADTLVKTNYVHVTLGVAPIAASCSPATTLYCCGYGVFNVSFAGMTNSTGPASEGYQDYTCFKTSTVVEGFTNLLQVQTGVTNAQDTRVWIDYNNDGNFSNGEMVLISNNQFNPSASVTIPVGAAVLNTPLRMRVWTDYAGSLPGPCTSPNRGQVEDYTVIVTPNTTPPLANFTADLTVSCGGLVNFTDASINTVSSWSWDFGDGSALSTSQNPSHQYAAAGVYTVTLIVSSAYGADTLIKNAYINVVSTSPGPITPSCAPATSGYCCGIGITNYTFNTLNNSTGDGVEGYSDYSCMMQTTVTAGTSYPVSITTGATYTENVRIWIDYNNDGSFNNTDEQVYSDFNHLQNHTGTIAIPASVLTNVPLRMRVISDYNNPLATACAIPVKGQVEDYGIVISPNNNPPVASFTANTTLTCTGVVNFTSTSTNASSQVWDFGDVSTSTLANPTHTYTSSGQYTVQLIVTNANGSDTVIQTNYITVTLGNGPVPANCSPTTTTYCCGNGIYNVTFGGINNTTPDGVESYKDYTCSLRDTSLEGGLTTPISITTGPSYAENVRVYIDYNNNGNFNTANELVYAGNGLINHNGIINVPSTGVVFYTNLRMRVISNFYNIANACANVVSGQVEDYTVFIKHTLGNKDLLAGEELSVYPNPSNGNYQIDYSFEGKKEIKVTVSDVLGRAVYSKEMMANSSYKENIDMSNVAKGVYILKIVADQHQITRKIYIQ